MGDHLTDAFIESVRDVYRSADPVFTELLAEQIQFKMFFAMFRAALEVQNNAESAEFIATINRLLVHFDKTAAVIGAHQGIAMSVNAVMREHEID